MLPPKENMPWPAMYYRNAYSINEYTTHNCNSNYNSTARNCAPYMYRRLDKMAKPG
jgi:hypothetical protein